jgi:hypothetical protein
MENVSFIQWLIGTMIAVATGAGIPVVAGLLWVKGKIAEFQTTLLHQGIDLTKGDSRFKEIERTQSLHGEKLADHHSRLNSLERYSK